jgi:RimJ/RimL family protein N-acetyltransferase
MSVSHRAARAVSGVDSESPRRRYPTEALLPRQTHSVSWLATMAPIRSSGASRAAIMYPDPPLCDEIVLLRPWREEDIPSVVRAASDPSIERWNHLPQPFDDAAVRSWFVSIPEQLEAGEAIKLLMVNRRHEAELFGAVALFNITENGDSAEIGCWVAASARGHGIAFRAVQLLIRWAFATLHLEEMFAEVDADNQRAQELLVRSGFTRRGDVPDSEPPARRLTVTPQDLARVSSTQ